MNVSKPNILLKNIFKLNFSKRLVKKNIFLFDFLEKNKNKVRKKIYYN